jgi:hypothetical protein
VLFGTQVARGEEGAERRTEALSSLRVSVGDFRVVVEAAPWAWAIPATEYSPETSGSPGEPAYVRPPRCMPVHATIPNLVRHPLTGDIVLVYSPYLDGAQEYSMTGVCVSRDGGWTWTPAHLVRELGCAIGPCGREWIGLSFLTGYEPQHPDRVRVLVHRSPDGFRWTADEPEAVVTFPTEIRPQPAWGENGGGAVYDNARSLRGRYRCPATFYIHKRVVEREGALYAGGYEEHASRNYLIRSDDQGKSWRFFADIGRDCEADFCWLANGDMIAEARCNLSENPRPLLQTRSTDGGRTWSKPIPAPGVELATQDDRRWFSPQGKLITECSGANIDPALLPMGNGVIALAYGRPGLSLRFNVDGTGNHWDHRTAILPKYAVTDGKPWAFPVRSQYTHAMCGMVALSARTLLLASNIYGYSPTGDPEKGQDVVFVVPVSIRRSGTGNAAPRLTGPGEVTSMPGREVLVRLELSDPDGDWVRLRCQDAEDIEIRGNAVSWRMPWEFRGERTIVLFAEDAWGATSPDHSLVVRPMDREN